jgi:hypothetical protein
LLSDRALKIIKNLLQRFPNTFFKLRVDALKSGHLLLEELLDLSLLDARIDLETCMKACDEQK